MWFCFTWLCSALYSLAVCFVSYLGALSNRQRTPAKFLPMHSPPISSPQPATCAPSYTGDLPLPTKTPTLSSVSSPAAPEKQVEPSAGASPKSASPSTMSIQQWVTKTPPNSSPPVKGAKRASPRKALTDISQVLSEVPPASQLPHLRSETRAKRRLESSKEENAKQKCMRDCHCVTELDLLSKKPRLEQCVLAVESKPYGRDCLILNELDPATSHLKTSFKPRSPCSPTDPRLPLLPKTPCGKMADKENGSPDNKNWLSALGDKLRTAKSSSPNRLDNSTQSPRFPSARRQEAKTGITTVSRFRKMNNNKLMLTTA